MIKKFVFAAVLVALLYYLFQVTNQRQLPQSSIGPRPQVQITATPQPSVVPSPQAIKGEQRMVTRVIDGDTIVVEGDEKIRYIGMDTPEKNECYFKEATDANKKLVEGKTVTLQYDIGHLDRYGRTLAYIYVDNIFANEQLLLDGYAQVETVQPNVKYAKQFLKDQQTAREQNKGLWSSTACH